jgi:tight adherence protein B
MRKIANSLSAAGITRTQPAQFVLLVIAGLVLSLALLTLITNSLLIASSVCFCVAVQLIDTFQNRIKAESFKANSQWPKYLDSIHSAAWAGASLEQSILDSISFAPPKLAWALLEFEKDQSAGVAFTQSLDNLKVRLANPVADRFIEITRLASASGGRGYLNALRNQSLQLRLENATWTEIQVKQNWVLGTAKLAVLAPWLVLVLLSLRPETAIAFQTEVGIAVLIIGLVASLLAFRLVKALGALPERVRTLGV